MRPGGRVIIIEGANLLPVVVWNCSLSWVQTLIYGPAALFGRRKHYNLDEEKARLRQDKTSKERLLYTDRETSTGFTTEVLPYAWFGRFIPLERVGLHRRSEKVRSRRWEVYIIIGEKILEKTREE